MYPLELCYHAKVNKACWCLRNVDKNVFILIITDIGIIVSCVSLPEVTWNDTYPFEH